MEALTFPESQIYSRSAFYRLHPDKKDEQIRATYLNGTKVVYAGTSTDYEFDTNIFKEHFVDYRSRPSEYFEHMDPQSMHYALWNYNCYFLPTNWTFRANSRVNDHKVLSQYEFISGMKLNADFNALTIHAEINSEGHFVAPWGFHNIPEGFPIQHGNPHCSCGSFMSQMNYIEEFKRLLGEDFLPTCKHISYMHKMAEYKAARQKIIKQQEESREFKSVALFLHTPSSEMDDMTIHALYIDDRSTAPINKWKVYNKNIPIPSTKSWEMIDKIMKAGYVPFPGHRLSNLVNYKFQPNIEETLED